MSSFLILLSLLTNPLADSVEVMENPALITLSFPAGARAVGMGSSATGKCDDPIGIKYNPGAIGFFDNFQLAIMNQGPPPGIGRFLEDSWLMGLSFLCYDETENLTPESPWLPELTFGMRYIYGAGVYPVKNYGVFGLNYLYFTTRLVDVIDPEENYIGSYYSYDYAIGFSYGRCINRFGGGFTAKYVYSFLFPDWIDRGEGGSGHTMAFDFGFQCRLKGLNAGISLLNLGPRIKYGNHSSGRLPTRYNWGISIEPVVFLDSILFAGRQPFKNFEIHDIINIKFNLDRSYDLKYPEKDIWHGSGWEFKIFNYFAYRCGSFEWMGESNGFGLNLGIYSIDITEFFSDLNSYHVQITINPALSKYATDDYTKRRVFTIGSMFVAPGCTQFYKGEGIKGALFFVPALYLSNYYFKSSDETKKSLSIAGIGLLYLGSAIEILISK